MKNRATLQYISSLNTLSLSPSDRLYNFFLMLYPLKRKKEKKRPERPKQKVTHSASHASCSHQPILSRTVNQKPCKTVGGLLCVIIAYKL